MADELPDADAIAPPGIRPATAVLTLLVVGAFLNALSKPIVDSELWTQVRYGALIIETARRGEAPLPQYEPFSQFSDKSQDMLHLQHRWQGVCYVVYKYGARRGGTDEAAVILAGTAALRTVHAFILGVGFLAWAVALRRVSRPWIACVGFTALALLTDGPLSERHTLWPSIACFGVLVATASSRAPGWGHLLLLVAIQVVWSHIHPSFVLGTVFLLVITFGRAVEAIRATGFMSMLADPKLDKLLMGLSIGTVACVLLSPHQVRLFEHVLLFFRLPNVQSLAPYLPMEFHGLGDGPVRFLIALAGVTLAHLLSRDGMKFTGMLATVVFAVWPLFESRMLVAWLLIAPWVACGLFPERDPTTRDGSIGLLGVTAFLTIGATVMTFLRLGAPIADREPIAILREIKADPTKDRGKYVPELAANFGTEPAKGTVLAEPELTDFLSAFLGPNTPTAYYGHAWVFPADHWRDCREALAAKPGWRDFLDRADVRIVVTHLGKYPKLEKGLADTPGWKIVRTENYFLATRPPEMP